MAQRMLLATRATLYNELRLLLRDRFCLSLLACFSIGLAWASWSSSCQWRDFSNQQSELQAEAHEAWLSQPTTNAHMATHFGQTVYKPVSPLAGFDPGAVSKYGSSVFLQAHHQSSPENPLIYDEVDLLQNEAYSPAVLLELFGPLLIIVLGIASIAREKEGGTLSILLTSGAPWSAIAMGKCLATLFAIFVVAAPGLFLLALPWFESNCLLPPLDLGAREIVLVAALAIYYAGWFGVTVWVTAKSRSLSGSFSVLIALWSIVALVMPRIAGDVASFASPLPTYAEIRMEKENAIHSANQSSVEQAKATQTLEEKLLKQFKVERIEDLPIDIAGARMIAQEDHANQLYDEIEKRVSDARKRQNDIIGGFQFASPYMAMRAVSTSFTATHRNHHFDFMSDAENYRRQYVKELNTAEMNGEEPGNLPEEQRQFWSKVTEYQPGFVSVVKDISGCVPALACVGVWGLLAVVASLYGCPRRSES